MTRAVRFPLIALLVVLTGSCPAQQATPPRAGTLVEATVSSAALKTNLVGDAGESRVVIYLPPSYATSLERRYPALYLLHGYLTGVEVFGARPGTRGFQGMQLAPTMDELIGRRAVREMIVVAPNGRNAYFGTFYTNSSVTGGWEDFIALELVSWVDDKYRTIPRPASRGIAGHSMGGYGAIMLAMKHPGIFSAVYALSPCCLGLEADIGPDNQAWRKAMQLQSRNQLQPRPQSLDEFYPTAMIAMSAAFSPNPDKAPLYVDLPFRENNGRLVPNEPAYSMWRSKMPLYLVEQYRENLQKLNGIHIDYGALEPFSHIRVTTRAFSAELASREIPHAFEVYGGGDHENKVRERIETHVLRFFSEVLAFVEPRAPLGGN
jgi:S-formylglutathione hydrolase